jgi:hypothetical protein
MAAFSRQTCYYVVRLGAQSEVHADSGVGCGTDKGLPAIDLIEAFEGN